MKKFYILFFAIVTAFSCCCTSCSNDDDGFVSTADLPEAILGTWEVIESSGTVISHDNMTGEDNSYSKSDNYANGSLFRFFPITCWIESEYFGIHDSARGRKYTLEDNFLNCGMKTYWKIQIKGNLMIWDGNIPREKNHLVLKRIRDLYDNDL